MKICSRCHQEISLDNFYSDNRSLDGKQSACKFCQLKYQKEYRTNNEELKKHNRSIYAKKKKDIREKRRIEGKEQYKKFSEHYKFNSYKRRKEKPGEVEATRKLNVAINSGKIIRPSNCQKCGENIKVDGHHEDYNKPFEVTWLCRSCHLTLHRNENVN